MVNMLEKLLDEIRRGGTFETGALAKKMGTTPQMVQVMLEHLQQTGHIRPYQACGGSCQACGESAFCKAASGTIRTRLWQG
jgi:Mn-dependent DtxR family transcriptional regulator